MDYLQKYTRQCFVTSTQQLLMSVPCSLKVHNDKETIVKEKFVQQSTTMIQTPQKVESLLTITWSHG